MGKWWCLGIGLVGAAGVWGQGKAKLVPHEDRKATVAVEDHRREREGKFIVHRDAGGKVVLPDLGLTPGVKRTGKTHVADGSGVCDKTPTSVYRKTTVGMKREVCLEYGLAEHCWGPGKAEIDHLISLQLGGADEVKNLWPQAYSPKPGALEKDVLEGWLHRQVCSGKMPLETAQRKIVQDWYAAYEEMLKEKNNVARQRQPGVAGSPR